MATQVTLMMAVATIGMILPLLAIKILVTRALQRRRGPEAAKRGAEAGRVVIVASAMAVICASALFLGPQSLTPEMIASVH